MILNIGDLVLSEAHPMPCKIGVILPEDGNANIYVEYTLAGQLVFDWLFKWEISKKIRHGE